MPSGGHDVRVAAAYEIRVDEERAIAEVRLSAGMGVADHVRARNELMETCRAQGIRRILVDARQLGRQPTTPDLFAFASGWPAILRQAPVVVAGVLPENSATLGWWRFGEDVAVNRGLIAHPFETVEDARAWLARW